VERTTLIEREWSRVYVDDRRRNIKEFQESLKIGRDGA
jgi:hypothetical protein